MDGGLPGLRYFPQIYLLISPQLTLMGLFSRAPELSVCASLSSFTLSRELPLPWCLWTLNSVFSAKETVGLYLGSPSLCFSLETLSNWDYSRTHLVYFLSLRNCCPLLLSVLRLYYTFCQYLNVTLTWLETLILLNFSSWCLLPFDTIYLFIYFSY